MIKRSLAIQIFLGVFIVIVVPFIMIIGTIKIKYEGYLNQELKSTIDQTLIKSEEDIYEHIYNILNFSNGIVYAEDLNWILSSDASYYDKYKIFNNVLNQLYYTEIYDNSSVQVTIIEQNGNIYSNWERGFDNYSFLNDKSIVLKSKSNPNDIIIEFFTDGFINQEDGKCVCIARSILHKETGEIVGTLIVSINQSEISEILNKYLYNYEDSVYLCDQSGNVILKNDIEDKISGGRDNILEVINNIPNDNITSISGREYIVSNYELDPRLGDSSTKFNIYYFTEYNGVMNELNKLSMETSVLIFFAIQIICIFIVILIMWIVRPIKVLAKSMSEYDMNIDENELMLDTKRADEIGNLNNSFYKMNSNIKELFRTINEQQKIKEQYKINYLKAQLNPHFLFNTLGAIKWMAVAKNTEGIVDTINALGDMLKYSMGKESDIVTVKEEIKNIEGYIKIQNIRYGHICDLQINYDSKTFDDYKIIRFILQPIVENAIIHGFKEKKPDNLIKIIFSETDKNFVIKVKNNGELIEPHKLKEIKDKLNKDNIDESYEQIDAKSFNSIGMINIHTQIKLRYGKEYGVSINYEEGVYLKSDNKDTKCIVVEYLLPKQGG